MKNKPHYESWEKNEAKMISIIDDYGAVYARSIISNNPKIMVDGLAKVARELKQFISQTRKEVVIEVLTKILDDNTDNEFNTYDADGIANSVMFQLRRYEK